MNQKRTRWATLAASIFAGGALATNTQGQSSDALLNTLLKKGILTEKEAQDIKAEASKETQKDFNQAFSAKTGMPAWITNYKLYGDFRGRFEENNAENPLYHTRDRYRYRLRIGLNATMVDNFDVGLRLASGNPQFNSGGRLVGGQPITANQDLNSLETRKFIWIDAAYGRWTPIKNNDWTVSATIGKMDNPFTLSNMIWDYDINPEGAALQTAYNITDQHTLKANGAWFVLDEFNQGAPSGAVAASGAQLSTKNDPYLYGGQLLLESKWTPKIDTALGVAGFNIIHRDSLSSQVQPFYNAGNTRDAFGFVKYHFNPVIGTASATYKLATFPLYAGQFPLKVSGEYMKNPAAPSDRNTAYRAGVTLGKAGRKGTWEISYRYQRLEADAWFDALVDDDNGAFYGADPLNKGQLAGSGSTGGWFGGTNVKGHQLLATYSFTDFLNFTFTYYMNEAVLNIPGQPSKAGHFMADLNWKF